MGIRISSRLLMLYLFIIAPLRDCQMPTVFVLFVCMYDLIHV